MSRVLVTGATGFIGRHAVRALVAAGQEVHAVTSRDHRGEAHAVTWHRADLLASPGVVAEVAPDLLLHLAWYVQPGRFWTSSENVRWVEASLALLRAFAETGGRRAVVAGTSAEYDWRGGAERFHEYGTPLRPANLYGEAKNALHSVAARYAEQAGFELAWGRIFFVYGPGEAEGRLVPSVGRALLAGEPVRTTRGDQVRDFMYVEDAGAAFAGLAQSHITGAVNVASGRRVTVREMVATLAELAGRPDLLRLGALPGREGDPRVVVADVSRLRNEVGFVPRIGLVEGVRETLRQLRAPSKTS